MSYSSKFIEGGDSARDLLLEAGYASAAAIDAVTKLSELCIYVHLIDIIASSHTKNDPLPPHFEAELDIKPIRLRSSSSLNLIEDLENRNVLVPRGGKYRVMLSNMMNRVFSLTAISGTDSIRSVISNLHDVTKFSNALETIEWDLVTVIHDHIDVKYLDIPSLEQNKMPLELMEIVDSMTKLVSKMDDREIELSESSETLIKRLSKGDQASENMAILVSYLTALKQLSEQIELEGKDRWKVIQGATRYPVSLLNRNGPPLIKSSWHLKPDFRNHPLIEKFKNLMSTNLEFITGIVTIYEDFINGVVDRVAKFPRGVELIDALREKNTSLPPIESISSWWTHIDKQAPGLKAQLRLLSSLVSNVDTLFQDA